MLSTLGFGVPKDRFSPLQLTQLKEELTVQPDDKGYGTEKKPYVFWKESPTRLYVPPQWGTDRWGEPPSHFPWVQRMPEVSKDPWEFNGTLRPAQQEAIEAFLGSPHQRGVLQVYCGFGKTCCALAIASHLRMPTLVIVNEEELGHQWEERIHQFLPNARVGWIQGETIEIDDREIIIGMLQSLSRRGYDSSRFQRVGLKVVDECHIVGSEVYTRCLLNMGTPWSLGLSATPRRKDGLTHVIGWFLGPTVFNQSRPPTSVKVQVYSYSSDDPTYATVPTQAWGDHKVEFSKLLTTIATWPDRNELIVQILMDLLKDPTRQILVLSERRETQLETLRTLLEREGEMSVGFYVGRQGSKADVHRAEIERARGCRVVLATYQKAKQGLDLGTLNTVLFATPQADVEQASGRILREGAVSEANDSERPKATEKVIVDIVDSHGLYKAQYRKRKAYYDSQGYVVVRPSSPFSRASASIKAASLA